MINKIIELCLKNRFLVIAVFALLIVGSVGTANGEFVTDELISDADIVFVASGTDPFTLMDICLDVEYTIHGIVL